MSRTENVTGPRQVTITPPVVATFFSQSTTLDLQFEVSPFNPKVRSAKMEALVADAMTGKPLSRANTTNDLAAKACAERGRKPASGRAWASKLAVAITSVND